MIHLPLRNQIINFLLIFAAIFTGCSGQADKTSVANPINQPELTETAASLTFTSTPPENNPDKIEQTQSAKKNEPFSEIRPELEQYFQSFDGAFVLYDQADNRYTRYNPDRCAQRLTPASTFKILNSLIGLETGKIPDENYVIKWDGINHENPTWNQDHSMKTAFQNSVVWYYQELARRVGKEKMQYYVDLANYGNRDLSGKIDEFWLVGGLKISANEQVEFLKRLKKDDLPFSERSMHLVTEMLVLEKTETYQLSGKTGFTYINGDFIGWFVGYIEKKDNIYFFATNILSAKPAATGIAARDISRNLLRDLKLLQ